MRSAALCVSLKLRGFSQDRIARFLNDEKVLPPAEYSSLASYQQIYVKKLSPMLGCMEVGELSKKVIVPFMNDLMDNSGLSVKYCNDILIVLKMLIRFADEEL